VKQIRETIRPSVKKDVCWKEEDGTFSYKGNIYNSEKELVEASPDVDLMYVISFVDNSTGKVVNHD